MTKKKHRKKSYIKYVIFLWILVFFGIFTVAFTMVCAKNGWLVFDKLPGLKQLKNPKSNLASEVITADGKTIGSYYTQNRINVPYDSISLNAVHALVATEDHRYYQHSGIDYQGLVRAIVTLGGSGGGSTITQQLAKMLFNEPATSIYQRIKQKLQEWIIAVELEHYYTKDEIIDMYFNRLDFVNNAVGINSASHIYFGKQPSQLNINEAAMFVGMAKNPSLFNPLKRPKETWSRRNTVLHQMLKNDYISQTAYDSLKKKPLHLNFHSADHKEGIAPYFRAVLRSKLKKMLHQKDDSGNYLYHKKDGSPYNIYTDGLKVFVTLDSRYQKAAEWAVKRHMTNLQNQFNKKLKNKSNAPFSWKVSKDQIKGIMTSAVHRSPRYLILTGKQCANCGRRGDYVKTIYKDGKKYYKCQASDCGYMMMAPPKDSIEAILHKPVKMELFSYDGPIDTVLSPYDSIRYYKGILQAGLMSINPHTGYIKAWVGGVDFKRSPLDHVYQTKRQVGSAFKPFVYAVAIRSGVPPCRLIPNIKYTFYKGEYGLTRNWTPINDGGKYGYNVTLKYGLANSLNTITAWVMKQYGPEAVIDMAHKMGIQSHLDTVPSLALGVTDLSLYEMVGGFGTIANQGIWIEPTFVKRIEDKNGNVIINVVPKSHEAIDEQTAYVMTEMLEAVVDGAYNKHLNKTTGTGMRLRGQQTKSRPYVGFKTPMGGKTGTSQNNSDGWYFGLTPDLVTGVWVGANDRSVHFASTYFGQGANTGLPIWGYYMHKVYDDSTIKISKGNFEKPEKPLTIELNCREYLKNHKEEDFSSSESEDNNFGS